MTSRVAISLFDESGNMLRPWAEQGYECHVFDIVNSERSEGNLHWHGGDLRDRLIQVYIRSLRPSIVFGFPPCTDLAVSGAKHFAAKRAQNPAFQAEALELVMIPVMIADQLGVPYMVENPISVLSTLWRKPDYIFNPCDYGGYLPPDDVHPRFPDIIPPRDAYKKTTCLWVGNGFVIPPVKRVPLISPDNPGWKKLGGKSARTKKIRSETPRGFAIGACHANLSRDD